MGGSPPPPAPKPQPRENSKEESMYWRNNAFDAAITAATNSYTAASILKGLAEILDPLTEQQLRAAIDEFYRNVTEFYRAFIIYSTTVKTFMEVDGLIRSAIDTLINIQSLGETHLNHFDQSVVQYITTNSITLFTKQAELQKIQQQASTSFNAIRSVYESLSTSIEEKESIYARESVKLQTACTAATQTMSEIFMIIEEMKTRISDFDSLDQAANTRPVISSTIEQTRNRLRSTTAEIKKTYTKNIETYNKELEIAKRWYQYYKAKADLVRDKNRIIINPEILRRVLDIAKSAHMNAIYAAIFAYYAGTSADARRNTVHPDPYLYCRLAKIFRGNVPRACGTLFSN